MSAGEYQVSNGSSNAIDKGNLANPITQSHINIKVGDGDSGWVHEHKHAFGVSIAAKPLYF
ncbi:hypothetical protein I6L80_21040 (plasmid) [Providencia rettgeri]|uniref:Uncharacterized protein n=1 Tax=Providencia rettgeri TaxID=587 RepID=A0A379LQN7_PRORE|nr:hypothetical protein I6L80_21040 [Providencia rettgeri]SUD99075.1 Uncharacterised protein [Providencia rettgeri]